MASRAFPHASTAAQLHRESHTYLVRLAEQWAAFASGGWRLHWLLFEKQLPANLRPDDMTSEDLIAFCLGCQAAAQNR